MYFKLSAPLSKVFAKTEAMWKECVIHPTRTSDVPNKEPTASHIEKWALPISVIKVRFVNVGVRHHPPCLPPN
jgi:hypothetical protein